MIPVWAQRGLWGALAGFERSGSDLVAHPDISKPSSSARQAVRRIDWPLPARPYCGRWIPCISGHRAWPCGSCPEPHSSPMPKVTVVS